jgi:hypothetical protein
MTAIVPSLFQQRKRDNSTLAHGAVIAPMSWLSWSLGNRSSRGEHEWHQPGNLEGAGVVANAVLSIVSAIIGGGLVLAGQLVIKRAEDKWVWLIRLQEAASDLATSYLQEAAIANDRRRAGAEMSQVETATYTVDRQKALGRFRTLPWSSEFEALRQAMGRGIEGVWRAWDESDDEFQLAYKGARAAVAAFMAAVGAQILRDGAYR